jgi:hypothetical protein
VPTVEAVVDADLPGDLAPRGARSVRIPLGFLSSTALISENNSASVRLRRSDRWPACQLANPATTTSQQPYLPESGRYAAHGKSRTNAANRRAVEILVTDKEWGG